MQEVSDFSYRKMNLTAISIYWAPPNQICPNAKMKT